MFIVSQVYTEIKSKRSHLDERLPVQLITWCF